MDKKAPLVWNHKARYRLAERPMFRNWLEYVESLPETAHKVDPDQIRAAAVHAFGKQGVLQQVVDELDMRRRVKVKFNSKLTMEWTDETVTGKPLGELTAAFKDVYPLTRLVNMTEDEIKEAFVKFHQARRQRTAW